MYDPSKSTTASNLSTIIPGEATYGAGHVIGFEAKDKMCLQGACAQVRFLQSLEESDQPFLDAAFDGVLGLSLPLRSKATTESNVLEALASQGAIARAQFSVFMARDLHSGSSEITFGTTDENLAASATVWASVSEPGYWQFSLSELAVGGRTVALCGHNGTGQPHLENGTNVTSYFGKMCCRTVEEFEHEDRCQYSENYTGWRSKTVDSSTVLASFDDGRVAVRMRDGCVQKVPRRWLSLETGCRGDGTIQAILDTGSSLLMGPQPVVKQILASIGVRENCTGQDLAALPPVSFTLHEGGHQLSLSSKDYMDVLSLSDGTYCWPHFLAAPTTGKGAALVLGMPFLRAYYTTFDAKGQRVGFAPAREAPLTEVQQVRPRSVSLRSRRPASLDANLAAALRTEHWSG